MQKKPIGARSGALRILRARPWRILLPAVPKPRTAGSSSLVLLYGFAALIIVGTVLLMLPAAAQPGQTTTPLDAAFTATSAVCVTGLVVVDTADHWSIFGQIVILGLIQLGGFGFMTTATIFLLMFGRRIGLREKLLIGESLGMEKFGGMVRTVWQMGLFTLLIEAAGAALLYFFTAVGSHPMPVWKSVFHAVSAFNNAGFDIYGGFASLTGFQQDPAVLLVTAALIILGGISFLVVMDTLRTRDLAHLSLDSKLVLSATGLLLVLGTVIFLLTEFMDPGSLGPMPVLDKVVNAFFQSVTARTAGFNTVNMGVLSTYALFFTMLLMFVGGASGSTAGGIKVNNLAMLAATVGSTIRGREHPAAFGREFHMQQIHRALAVAVLSLSLVSVVVFLLTLTEEGRFIELLFETFSAFGTVGLSTGITPALSGAGRLIIIATMFIGRLGPLTLTLALVQRQKATAFRYPRELVRIG